VTTDQLEARQHIIDTAIRLGLIVLLVLWCLYIIAPFISLVAWGAIIAVAIYPAFLSLQNRFGGNKKMPLILMTIIALAAVLLPAYMMSSSLIHGAAGLGESLKQGTLTIPVPEENIKTWPLVGETVYDFWHQASANLTGMLETYHAQLVMAGKKIAAMAASLGLEILQFVASTMIAIAFLAQAESGSRMVRQFACKVSGKRGEQLVTLSTETIRSVANGLLGIALIQAVLTGLGMILIDVPAAGLLAFGVLILAIVQVPTLLLMIPVILYVFSVHSTGVAVVFAAWSFLVCISDTFLKPMLLGRGVEAPMLVILLGAIGGMIVSGIIGLFVGAVVLALGYRLFESWLYTDEATDLHLAD